VQRRGRGGAVGPIVPIAAVLLRTSGLWGGSNRRVWVWVWVVLGHNRGRPVPSVEGQSVWGGSIRGPSVGFGETPL